MHTRKFQLLFLITFAMVLSSGQGEAQDSDFYVFESAPTATQLLEVLGDSGTQDLEGIVLVPSDGRSTTAQIDTQTRSDTNIAPADDGGWNWVHTHINFSLGSSNVTGSYQNIVDTMGLALQQDTSLSVVVSGHADARGSHQINDDLSYKRAAAVKSYLVSRFGIAPERLILRWRGEREPFPGLDPYDPLNRRVQFGQRKSTSEKEKDPNLESDQQAVQDLLEILRTNQTKK